MRVARRATLNLNDLTIADGAVPFPEESSGGGIVNNGILNIANSTFSGNSAVNSVGLSASGGGAIFNSATLTLSNSTFSDNNAGGPCCAGEGGGGIWNNGKHTIADSTFSGNFVSGAVSFGGGIINFGTLTLTNSTFSGNFVSGLEQVEGGGGIDNEGGTLIITQQHFVGQLHFTRMFVSRRRFQPSEFFRDRPPEKLDTGRRQWLQLFGNDHGRRLQHLR